MNVRAKISSKGQLVVPKDIRDRLGFSEGSEVEFLETGDGVFLKHVPTGAGKFPSVTFNELMERRFKWKGAPLTDQVIEQAVLNEAKRRFDATRN